LGDFTLVDEPWSHVDVGPCALWQHEGQKGR